MWRQAVSELRLHPGRFIATLIAIAISVGFIAAISVFINSQQTLMASVASLPFAKADLVIEAEDTRAVAKKADQVDGVEIASPVPTGSSDYLTNGEHAVQATLMPVPAEALRWAKVVEGRFPEKEGEIALSQQGLKELGAKVGDRIESGVEKEVTIVGATDDPKSLWSVTGYTGNVEASSPTTSIAVALAPNADVAEVTSALAKISGVSKVTPAAQVRTEYLNQITGDFDIFKNLLQGFAGVALLVGMITIANTFTILAAQRRRQLALMRAIGASPQQVTSRLLTESFLLGAFGSAVGIGVGFLVAWIGGFFTGSNYFGLTAVPSELALAWGAGVVATVVAAVGPSLRAARVRPLEALQSVPTPTAAKRASLARLIICSLAAVAGVVLVFASRGTSEAISMVYALLAGGAVTIAVLGAAPLYISPLLKVGGRIFSFAGPTTRLAFSNAARNPKRAASTATALMLAVGLIVTLQVALATARTSGMEAINSRYPVDLQVSFQDQAVPAELMNRLEALDGVKAVVPISTKMVEASDGVSVKVSVPDKAYSALGLTTPASQRAKDDEIVMATDELTVVGVVTPDGVRQLTVKANDGLSYQDAFVSQNTFDAITGAFSNTGVWIQLKDRSSSSALAQVTNLMAGYPQAIIDGGGAVMASVLTQVLDVMLIVLTGLLGVAVLIALVGVGNTLGLSVLERQRESALLRALGMQRSSLQLMLLIEALALVGIGTVIGLAAGMLFGWLGVSTVLNMMPTDMIELKFSLDWGYTIGLLGICLVAAVVASILPGRRASKATPTEALAVE